TWLTDQAFKNNASIKLFLEFKSILEARAKDFESQFGVVPTFKAVLCVGDVLSSVSGNMEKRKAFYGQPLHQASRMLGVCKRYSQDFVCTESVKMKSNGQEIAFKLLTSKVLRGEQVPSKLYAVSEKRC
ncbi:MAG: hypothetical protein KI790_19410, partial [Cyclobacteriaceae bacterium]|nr:hypothetical protein [Cyclobacteriaceae bacterium HetDA_MAG_MS6]